MWQLMGTTCSAEEACGKDAGGYVYAVNICLRIDVVTGRRFSAQHTKTNYVSAKDDIDIDALAAEIEGAGAAKDQEPQKSKGKKKKEKKKQDFDEDDILKELEELSIEAQGGKVDREQPSTGKVNTEREVENDNEESISKQDKKRKGKSKKANLENDYDSEEVEDKDKKSKKAQKAKQDMLSGSDDDDHETQLKKSKGKTQKSNKKHNLSEEDETNIKKSKERGGGVSTGESGDESDEVSQSRKGQKKNQKPKSAPAAESGDDEEEPSFKVKTVAQKKAEKKERERKKREEEKAKLRKQKEKEELEGGKEPAKPKESLKKTEEKASPEVTTIPGPGEKGEAAAGTEADDNEGDKKKKDKKKKKGEKEEKEKEKKKGPSKATVKAMQEALAKMKEEEERAKKEEEERIRRLEELEAKRKEEERLEQERKERKKQKEKERKERLKKEGKLLTKAQREARARAEATLKLLQAQGVEVPSKDSVPKKRPVYEDKKRKKQQQPENKEESVEVTSTAEDAVELETPVKEEAPLPVDPVSEEKEEEDETEDAGLDDWEAMVSDEDGEKESKPVHIEVKEQNEVDEEEEEEDEEEEEEEESEESEDSEGSEDEDEKTSDEREPDSQAIGKQSMEKKPSKEISSDSEYDSDDDRSKEERAYDKAKRRIEKRRAENSKNMNTEKLRAPVICVLGHVDTGKTKILDKLRHTHVQDSEAGGITQQIGATNVPLEAINEQTKMVKNFDRENIKIPGMLIIDTPGHESFSNLRNRGSSLCDIAILVVDIMHGLEPQTIESINLLKSKKCPFIVALNKIDRLYDWKKSPDTDVAVTLKKQKKNTKDEFEERAKAIIVEFAKQGLNAALFYENKDPRTFVSLVPTSAHTGDGMGSLIALLVELTQTMLTKRLAECQELRAQVMEVKALPGMGTTIDVILINGRLREGDTIIVPGVEGPIVTQIRGLLLPPPMKELRVKNQYEKHKEVVAAQGVKILGKDLEKTLAGLPLLVAHKEDEVPVLKDELIHELKQTLNAIKLEEKGVYVQASTLGSLEALLEFLKTSEVPYSGINIGPVHKKDVMKASVMLEHDPQYAVILAFDVRIERDAQEMADSLGVRIFSAEIIYHLFDAFTKYRQDYKKQKQEEFKHIAVFPCKLKILPQFIFNSRDPIVMGVVVEAGQVKQGTPMCVPSKNISRQSIDALKDWFRDEMQKSDWQLIVELKKVFEII
ncbi:eukaryotic translation initiation factor 5B isoform X9 [Parus major]|uniref:eukaryotic translation initiation factor 5B isoform X9 n=1 Tax=Parus major TaxID=9157 RepID=UPI001443FB10|nr:eukaryotic translation initiation factor 5B isoform X9 [Parus major]